MGPKLVNSELMLLSEVEAAIVLNFESEICLKQSRTSGLC